MNENAQIDPFSKPKAVSGIEVAFGGLHLEKLLPPWDTIPDEFKSSHNKWNKVVSRWFFSGLPEGTRFIAKAGIDEMEAKRHVRAIMVSYEPKHEHKEAGCAYLLSKWFDDVQIPTDV